MNADTQIVITTAVITAIACFIIGMILNTKRWVKQEAKHYNEMQKIREEYRAERQTAHEKRMAEIKAEGDEARADMRRRTDARERRSEIDEALRPIIRRLDKLAPRTPAEIKAETEALITAIEREN